MTYTRKPLEFPKYDIYMTEHYRDGELFATTEQKRQHDFTDADTLTDMAGRQRKFQLFCSLMKRGRHDMACYIYLIT